MNKARRNYTAAPATSRCAFDIKLRDGSAAQCMRRSVSGYFNSYCKQHDKLMSKALSTVAAEILRSQP